MQLLPAGEAFDGRDRVASLTLARIRHGSPGGRRPALCRRRTGRDRSLFRAGQTQRSRSVSSRVTRADFKMRLGAVDREGDWNPAGRRDGLLRRPPRRARSRHVILRMVRLEGWNDSGIAFVPRSCARLPRLAWDRRSCAGSFGFPSAGPPPGAHQPWATESVARMKSGQALLVADGTACVATPHGIAETSPTRTAAKFR